MKIHVIGTVNGQFDEGMRNVATHIANAFEKEHTVYYSGLKSVLPIIKNSMICNVSMVFARANKRVYWLARIVSLFTKNIWLVCVQKPDSDFIRLVLKSPLKVNYLATVDKDLEQIVLFPGYRKMRFELGIKSQKFSPVNTEKQKMLKEKYGLNPEKTLVIHVGHCSAGRGLTDFSFITDAEKLVVASGLFEDIDTINDLEKNNVKILKGYMENVEEIYQMADVYLFPTHSTEFVISVPLSVMEALSCGVPVVAYSDFVNLSEIPSQYGGITLITSNNELNDAVVSAAHKKCNMSFLKTPKTWAQVTEEILQVIKEE